MAYVKNTWVDQAGQVRYTETDDSGYKVFTANYDNVTELGTPVNATNMNHIEQGIYDNDSHIGVLSNLATTVKTDLVSAINEVKNTGSGLKLGQTIWSPDPLIDSDLHLYNGSQYSTGGVYADFVTNYLAPLKTAKPDRFKTEADWQTIDTQYGACGYWVLDTANNVFRFPHIEGIIENTTTEADLGKITEAGLPNITGQINKTDLSLPLSNTSAFTSTGALDAIYGTTTKPYEGGSSQSAARITGFGFNASNSNTIYGNSNTVQPQTVSGYLYCVVANGQTPIQAETDINEIATDLAGKADVDLTNVNNVGTSKSAGWAMPSSTYDNLTLGATGTTYTAPANGYFCLGRYTNSTNQYIGFYYMDGTAERMGVSNQCSTNGAFAAITIPVYKGQVIKVSYNAGGSIDYFRFIYAVGSESEGS